MTEKMHNSRKRRSENWTLEERDILLEIIKRYRYVLDNQNTNANTNKLKKFVWNQITSRFQQLSNSKRNEKQLKSFWKRLKISARKKARLQFNAETADDEEPFFCDNSSSHESTSNTDAKNNLFQKTLDLDKEESTYSEALKSTVSENGGEVILFLDDKNNLSTKSNADEMDVEAGDSFYLCDTAKVEIETDNDSGDELLTNMRFVKNNIESKRNQLNANSGRHNSQGNSLKIQNYKISLMQKEFMIKKRFFKLYHKKELEHQKQKHLLEIENLMLQRKRFEIELEQAKNSCI